MTLTPESIYAEARSWYEPNIRPFKRAANNDSDARILAMNVGNTSLGKRSVPVYGKSQKPGNKSQKQDKFKGSVDTKRADPPRDPNAWCGFQYNSI